MSLLKGVMCFMNTHTQLIHLKLFLAWWNKRFAKK